MVVPATPPVPESKQYVMDMLNNENEGYFTFEHISFGIPQPNTGEIDGNTALIITSLNTSSFTGTATLYYDRLDLSVMFGACDMDFPYDGVVLTTHDLIDLLNERFELQLHPDDLINEPLNLPAGFPKVQTLRAQPDSFGYIGSVTLNIVRPVAIEVTTPDEDPNFYLGWYSEGRFEDSGTFVMCESPEPSRTLELRVGGRARLGHVTAGTESTVVAEGEFAGEHIFTLMQDPDTEHWCVDIGARMGGYQPGERLESLYDVRLRMFHTNPSAGELTYLLEYVDGNYRFRDEVSNELLPVTYDIAGGHLISTSINMLDMSLQSAWLNQFGEVLLSNLGTPYSDQDVYPGWFGFEIYANAREDEIGQRWIGKEVSSTFLVDVQELPWSPWYVPREAPVSEDFETSYLFNGDWRISTEWSSGGTQSLKSSNIDDSGISQAWVNIIDGTGMEMSFDYRVESEYDCDYLRVLINDVVVWYTSGQGILGTCTLPLVAGPNRIEWQYNKDESVSDLLDCVWIDNVDFHVKPFSWLEPISEYKCTSFENGEVFNGTWAPSTTWAKDGVKSLRSASIPHMGRTDTWINIVDGTGGCISFDYNVSSESSYDFIRFYIGGNHMWSASGVGAGRKTFQLPPGPSRVEWRYTKDGSATAGMDAAFIDKVCYEAYVPPPPPVPLTRGFLVSNPTGSIRTANVTTTQLVEGATRPNLSNYYYAALAQNGANELLAIDGSSDRIYINASYDGSLTWGTATQVTGFNMSSNSVTYFRGSCYIIAMNRTDNKYGVYRINVNGTIPNTTFSLTLVTPVSGINAVLAAGEHCIAVYDAAGVYDLQYSHDGLAWARQAMTHPWPAATGTGIIYRVSMTFVGKNLIGVGRVSPTVYQGEPSAGLFMGIPGETFTWKRFEPYGVNVAWNASEYRLIVIGNDLYVATSSSSGLSTGAIWHSPNLGDSWVNKLSNTGIYPISFVDDGVSLLLVGFRDDTSVNGHWMAYSPDRGVTWLYDTDAGSWYGALQNDYTFAIGVKAPVTYSHYAYLYNNLAFGAATANDTTLGYGSIDVNTGANNLIDTHRIGTDQTAGVWVGSETYVACDNKRLYVTLSNTESYPSSRLHVFEMFGGELRLVCRYKRVLSTFFTSYQAVAVDIPNNIQYALEYRQVNVSPFTVSCELLALRWNVATNNFDLLGTATVPSNTRDIVVHNGYAVIYNKNLKTLDAYRFDAGTLGYVTRSVQIVGYTTSALSSQRGQSPMNSDGNTIHLFTGNNAAYRDTRHSFDGTTFVETWRRPAFTDSTMAAIQAGDLYITKMLNGSEDVYLNVYSIDGAGTTVLQSSDPRGNELSGLSYDSTNRILIAPTYYGNNTSGAQKIGTSGVYRIGLDYSMTYLNELILVEHVQSPDGDGRGAIFAIPKLPIGGSPARWSTTDKSTVLVVTGGNTMVNSFAGSNINYTIRSDRTRTAGNFYVEFRILACDPTRQHPRVGLHRSGVALESLGAGESWSLGKDGILRHWPDTDFPTGVELVVGDIVRMAGVVGGGVWLAVNAGAWIRGGDPVAGTTPTFTAVTGTLHIAAGLSRFPNGDKVELLSTLESFVYAAPDGFGRF